MMKKNNNVVVCFDGMNQARTIKVLAENLRNAESLKGFHSFDERTASVTVYTPDYTTNLQRLEVEPLNADADIVSYYLAGGIIVECVRNRLSRSDDFILTIARVDLPRF